jgi:hypothetical protein
MRSPRVLFGLTAAACLAIAPAYADGTKPPTAGSHPTGKPTTTSSKSSGKPTTSGTSTTSGSTTGTSTGSGSTGSTTTGSNTTKPNPIAAKIMSKPQLNSKISGMLPIDPATGKTMTLDKASLGFKNQGQFIAALHVSQNLGVSFIDLKKQMVTSTKAATGETTTQQTGSLGSAIQKVKQTSTTTANTEASKAETQATADVNATTSTQTTTTKKPKKTHGTGGA